MKEKRISTYKYHDTYYGSSEYVLRAATISEDQYHYIVKMYDNQRLIRTELLSDKSIHYARDMAENYVNGVGAFK